MPLSYSKIIKTPESDKTKNPLLQNTRFPHLLPQDVEVWLLFLKSPANIYTHFDYDVHVGDGRDPGTEYSQKDRDLGIFLSQRRIDAIGHHSTHLAIIEITRQAGLKAVGQLIAYPILYNSKYSPGTQIKPLLVAEEMQTDVLPAFIGYSIKTLLFKPTPKP